MLYDDKEDDIYSDYTLMPFGKFKGMPFSDIPLDYLRWLFNKDGATPFYSDVANEAFSVALETKLKGNTDKNI